MVVYYKNNTTELSSWVFGLEYGNDWKIKKQKFYARKKKNVLLSQEKVPLS